MGKKDEVEPVRQAVLIKDAHLNLNEIFRADFKYVTFFAC